MDSTARCVSLAPLTSVDARQLEPSTQPVAHHSRIMPLDLGLEYSLGLDIVAAFARGVVVRVRLLTKRRKEGTAGQEECSEELEGLKSKAWMPVQALIAMAEPPGDRLTHW